jgi:PPOX class probable F420-dependent enzyme
MRGRSCTSTTAGGPPPGADRPVELDRARAFLRDNHRAVLATRRSDGAPQLSPITVGIDHEGRAVISSRETAIKVRNLRRDPRAWLCVMNDGFFGDWISLEGPVEILPLPEAMEPLVEYYRSISGEHPDWDDYRAAMERDRRVVVRMTIERAGPDISG